MANIESFINMHNTEVITEKKTQAVNCNCINKPEWPFPTYAKLRTWYTKQKLHKTFETIMEKYTAEPVKVHLNSAVETTRYNSIIKNIGQIANFRRNDGDLKNSKHNFKYNFIF